MEVSTVYKAKVVQDACIRPAPTGFQSLNFFSESVDWEGIKNHIKQCDWSTMFQNKNVTEMLDCFYEVCLGAALNYVPERKLAKKKIHLKQKKVLRRRRQINKLLSRLKSPSRIDRLKDELLDIEKNLMQHYKQSESFQEHKALTAIKKNTKYFFKYAKKFSTLRSHVGPLKNENGDIISDSLEMVEMLSAQFSKMFSVSKPVQPAPNFCNQTLSDVDFNDTDIIESIDELRSNAAPGFDGFPAILLKMYKEELCEPLRCIGKESLKEGVIPLTLKLAVITPIHKGGSKLFAKQYRPVALTSHIIKLFEKILKKRLVSYSPFLKKMTFSTLASMVSVKVDLAFKKSVAYTF